MANFPDEINFFDSTDQLILETFLDMAEGICRRTGHCDDDYEDYEDESPGRRRARVNVNAFI